MPAAGGTPPSGTQGQSAFNTALAQQGQSLSPDSSGGMASPPHTPASAMKSPAAAAAPEVTGSGGSNAHKVVRGSRGPGLRMLEH